MYWRDGDFVFHPESIEEREFVKKAYEVLDGLRLSKQPMPAVTGSVQGDYK